MSKRHRDNPLRDNATESEIQNAIFEHYGREPYVTLYRNNTGVARSEVVTRAHLERMLSMFKEAYRKDDWGRVSDIEMLVGSLLKETPRFTHYGLCEGSSDIIGIVQTTLRHGRTVLLTDGSQHRLDYTHGIFLALEVKKPGKNPTREQQLFLDLVNRRGGVGACVHSIEEAGEAINRARAL